MEGKRAKNNGDHFQEVREHWPYQRPKLKKAPSFRTVWGVLGQLSQNSE